MDTINLPGLPNDINKDLKEANVEQYATPPKRKRSDYTSLVETQPLQIVPIKTEEELEQKNTTATENEQQKALDEYQKEKKKKLTITLVIAGGVLVFF